MLIATLLRGMAGKYAFGCVPVKVSVKSCWLRVVRTGPMMLAYLLPQSPMKSVNTVTLLGNVARDPELKATKGKHAVCSFGMATNRVWKDAAGQKQSLPEFHSIVAWGPLAEFCAAYVQKGNPLFVQGYLKTTSWEGKHGETQYRTEVVLEDVTLLGKKSREDDAAEDTRIPQVKEVEAAEEDLSTAA